MVSSISVLMLDFPHLSDVFRETFHWESMVIAFDHALLCYVNYDERTMTEIEEEEYERRIQILPPPGLPGGFYFEIIFQEKTVNSLLTSRFSLCLTLFSPQNERLLGVSGLWHIVFYSGFL